MLSLFMPQKLASTPSVLDDWWYGTAGRQTSSGIAIDESVAMTYSAVWACTRVLSASGSALPLSMHRRNGKMTEIASEHPAHRLIHSLPNAEMGTMGMRSIGLMRQVNSGNFFAEIARDPRGTPSALWPIDNWRVTPIRPDEQFARHHRLVPEQLAWQVKQDKGEPEYLADSDMFNVRSIISDNGIIGKGVIENARETIGHGLATVRQGAAYMKNSARPSVVITGGKFKDAKDREEYRRQWVAVHGSPENNARPAMMPQDSEVKVLSFSPEDSQFLQTLQFGVEDVARWYGVPPHMIQHLLRSTFSNIEHQGIDFVVYSLIPWLTLWEEEIHRKLLTPAEQLTHYAKHNVNGLLRGDSTARSAYYQAMWQLGAYSINEVRELEDMNPIEGGDQHFVQTSYTTLDRIGEVQDAKMKVDVLSTQNDALRDHIQTVGDRPDPDTQPLEITNNIQQPAIELTQPPNTELTGLVTKLVEYSKPPVDEGLQLQVTAVQEVATIMLGDALKRMLLRETSAIKKALDYGVKPEASDDPLERSKSPADFFAWLDGFYQSHESDLRSALSRPIHAHAASRGVSVDSDKLANDIAAEQLSVAKEAVLELTACQPEEWPQLNERFAALADEWRKTRAEQCITAVDDSLKAGEDDG